MTKIAKVSYFELGIHIIASKISISSLIKLNSCFTSIYCVEKVNKHLYNVMQLYNLHRFNLLL
jgi:hypothetical protein